MAAILGWPRALLKVGWPLRMQSVGIKQVNCLRAACSNFAHWLCPLASIASCLVSASKLKTGRLVLTLSLKVLHARWCKWGKRNGAAIAVALGSSCLQNIRLAAGNSILWAH